MLRPPGGWIRPENLNLNLPLRAGEKGLRLKGNPEGAGKGLGEGPGPNRPTSVTQQTQKDKVHLDGSVSGVKKAILTLGSKEMTSLRAWEPEFPGTAAHLGTSR